MTENTGRITAADRAEARIPDEAIRRFWRRTLTGPGCWMWRGTRTNNGYGVMSISGASHLAHRLSYMLNVGPIPEGLCVCHTCDVRLCVNPGHMFLGTLIDNWNDMRAKGRHWTPPKGAPRVGKPAMGEAHASAILTEEQVIEIRHRYAAGEMQKDLAQVYPISTYTISNIVLGKTWAHVGGPRTRRSAVRSDANI